MFLVCVNKFKFIDISKAMFSLLLIKIKKDKE